MNIGGNLKKFNLGKDGKSVGEYVPEPTNTSSDHEHEHGQDEDYTPQPDYHSVKQKILNGEGCKVKGTIIVNKVFICNLGTW